MTTENTNDQQPNPGEGVTNVGDAANPNAGTGTDPKPVPGQGEDGNPAKGTDPTKTPEAQGKETPEQPPVLTGAPEAYADFKLPEGYTLDGERLDLAKTVAKDFNLSQDGAQKLIDTYIGLSAKDSAGYVEGLLADPALLEPVLTEVRAKDAERWGSELKTQLADKYDETVALAKTGVQAVNDPKMLEDFNTFGWGNHPGLVKAFAMLGRLSRDSSIDGVGNSGAAKTELTLAQRMYPDMNK